MGQPVYEYELVSSCFSEATWGGDSDLRLMYEHCEEEQKQDEKKMKEIERGDGI